LFFEKKICLRLCLGGKEEGGKTQNLHNVGLIYSTKYTRTYLKLYTYSTKICTDSYEFLCG